MGEKRVRSNAEESKGSDTAEIYFEVVPAKDVQSSSVLACINNLYHGFREASLISASSGASAQNEYLTITRPVAWSRIVK
jgi:hypothetical protein